MKFTFKNAVATAALGYSFLALPGVAGAAALPSVQMTCSGTLSGTCTASGQLGGYGGSAASFTWESKNMNITPISNTTASFACPSTGGVGSIKAMSRSGNYESSATIVFFCTSMNP